MVIEAGGEQATTLDAMKTAASPSSHDAAASFLVVDVGGRRCGLPAERVVEIHAAVPPVALPGAPEIVRGVVNLRGHVVAVIDTRRRFALPPRQIQMSDCLVFVEACGRTMGLIVDAAVDLCVVPRHEVEIAAANTAGAAYACGVVVLSGGLVVIADLDAFLSGREAVALDEAMATAREVEQ